MSTSSLRVSPHLDHRAGEVHEMSANEQAGQTHRKGRAQAGNDQDCILRLLGHDVRWQQRESACSPVPTDSWKRTPC